MTLCLTCINTLVSNSLPNLVEISDNKFDPYLSVSLQKKGKHIFSLLCINFMNFMQIQRNQFMFILEKHEFNFINFRAFFLDV
jgi:hypothetical protein